MILPSNRDLMCECVETREFYRDAEDIIKGVREKGYGVVLDNINAPICVMLNFELYYDMMDALADYAMMLRVDKKIESHNWDIPREAFDAMIAEMEIEPDIDGMYELPWGNSYD